MKTFTIENNNITLRTTIQEAEATPNSEYFRNEAGLAKLAANWTTMRLVAIWNSLPGETPVKKFKDRATAVSRIWKALQSLGAAPPAANHEGPEAVLQTPSEAETEAAVTDIAFEDAKPITAEPEALTQAQDQPVSKSPAAAAVLAPVAPQTPDVAAEPAPANTKAARAKKTVAATKGSPREGTKTSQVIAMLKREGGTTLEEIMNAMGWQKHTTRAMLSAGGSLTKNHGIVITSDKVGDKRVYGIKV